MLPKSLAAVTLPPTANFHSYSFSATILVNEVGPRQSNKPETAKELYIELLDALNNI